MRKEYTLADLIDLAEQLNPATRAAWQNAKQALALVGVSKSAYYPFPVVSGIGRLHKILRSFSQAPDKPSRASEGHCYRRAVAIRGVIYRGYPPSF